MKKLISLVLITILTVLSISTGALAEAEQIDSGYLIFRDKSHGVKWVYDKSKTLSLVYIPKDDVANYPTKEFTDAEFEKYDMYGYGFANYAGFSVSEDFFDFVNYKIDCIEYGKGVSTSDFMACYLKANWVKFNGQSGVLKGLAYNNLRDIDVENFTEIGANALEGNAYLDSINLSNIKLFNENCMPQTGIVKINLKSAEAIGNNAFARCKNLKEIKFGKSLKSIGSTAFSKTSLKKVALPNSVEIIGRQAFRSCKKLEYVSIGNKVKVLSGTFVGCKNLKKVVLGKNVKAINNKSGGTWWSDVELPTFLNCKKLSTVVLKNTKNAPKFSENTFEKTKSGIKFYVKNKKVAKALKKNLKNTGVRKAKIYVGKKLVYKNITQKVKKAWNVKGIDL